LSFLYHRDYLKVERGKVIIWLDILHKSLSRGFTYKEDKALQINANNSAQNINRIEILGSATGLSINLMLSPDKSRHNQSR